MDDLSAGRRATSYDVAVAAGVAQSTVSRCYQPDSKVSDATRARVLAVAGRLGYVANAVARSLITRRSNMVAVLATRFTLRGNPDLIYALSEALAEAGKSVLLVPVANDLPAEAALRATLEYPLDGMISCATLDDAAISRFRARGVALLFYNRAVHADRLDWIRTDSAGPTAELARLLHASGHRRYLCVAGPPDAPVSRDRVAGFLAGLDRLGHGGMPVVHADYSYAGGRAAFLAHAQAAGHPDAVFCANDQLALGVLDACRYDLGLHVPADLSVVGFDDVAEAARPAYDLTTVRQDAADIAGSAVALLLARIADPQAAAQRVTVPAALMLRGSARLGSGRSLEGK